MIQAEDLIDRKLIALAGRSKAGLVRLLQAKIDASFFVEMYQPLVKEMVDYYRTYFELLTADTLSNILVDRNKEKDTITAAVATFEDIVNDADHVPSSELDYFIDRIKNRKALKLCEQATTGLANAVVAGRFDTARSVMVKAITSVDDITRSGEFNEGSISDFVSKRVDRYQERKDFPERFKGVQSGFPILDRVTDGYQPGELVIYVAESGGGKSVNLLHTAFQAWKEKYPGAGRGANVVLFTLEMDWEQYFRRFDAMHASLDSFKLKSASLDEREYGAWISCLEDQKQKQNLFYLVDMPSGCTTLFIRNKLEEIRMKYPDHPIDMVVIDYLGIMTPSYDVEGSDWLRQGIISQECKELARQERVTVLTAVQETRESQKEAKGPTTQKNQTALSRSHMIVTNANIILFFKAHQIEEPDPDYKIFNAFNNSPNIIHYQLIKSRDSKKVTFRCAADFSRMLIQPMDITAEEIQELDKSLVNSASPKIAPVQPVLSNPEDEEFAGYYEKVHTVSESFATL